MRQNIGTLPHTFIPNYIYLWIQHNIDKFYLFVIQNRPPKYGLNKVENVFRDENELRVD